MRYLVNAPASIAAGVLVLDAGQAAARRHALHELGEGRYQVMQPVQFKAGELIGYDGDLPKSLAALVASEPGAEPVSDVEPEKKPPRKRKTATKTEA